MTYKLLFLLPFLLTGCVGYINTSRHHDDISSVPYNIGIAPYIDLNKYSIADIKKINKNRNLVSEYSDGDMHYLEYKSPCADTMWTRVFFLVVPVFIPHLPRHNDTIRYSFQEGILKNIDYDYWHRQTRIIWFVPMDMFGHIHEKPHELYSGKLNIDFYSPDKYKDSFFEETFICETPVINDKHWNISGLNFVAPFEIKPLPKPYRDSKNTKIYYDYNCNGDDCTPLACRGDKCVANADELIESLPVYQTALEYMACGSLSGLGINGTLFKYDGYVIQIINAPHINRARAIEYINADAHPQMIENINGIQMTIIRQDSESGTTNIAIFFDDNHIYMIRQDTTTDNDGTEFNQLLHTVELDGLNVSQN